MTEAAVRVPGAISAEMAARFANPASYAEPEKLHRDLAWMRVHAPVARIDAPGIDPFWLVTRHKDIMDIERQPDIFRNGDRSTVLIGSPMRKAVEEAKGCPHLTRTMVNMDGTEHRAYRSLVQPWFMPGNVKQLTDDIRQIARSHVDRMLARDGACDFVADVALHYPLHVIMSILGVPEQDEQRMLMLTQQLFGARDPELSREADAMADPASALKVFGAVIADFHGYFSAITAKRRADPQDDLATVIANAVIDGKPIEEAAANDFYMLVATAGHDTTSASTAGAIWALAERPDLLTKVKAEPELIPQLVDEAIRWVTPVKHFMRSAASDHDVNGHAYKAGDWIMLSYMSANRDENVFTDPFEFRLDRPVNKQIAFGYGPHLCVGQHLARLEMRILFEELLPRISAIEVAGEAAWTQSNFISGPKRLPIRFTRS